MVYPPLPERELTPRKDRVCYECSEPAFARGYCGRHYETSWRRKHVDKCTVPDCDAPQVAKKICRKHYQRMSKSGTFEIDKSRHARNYTTEEWGAPFKINEGYLAVSRLVDGEREKRMHHRVVMEQSLGRELLAEETVHHINGIRNDNRLENLELWSSRHPKGQRVQDKVAWAKEMLALYDPDALS